jgi:cell division transport system permease protein
MTSTSLRPGPLVPAAAAPLHTLTAVMAVMCFLAVLAVGAMLLTQRAVSQWATGLASEATVQVPELSTRDMGKDLTELTAILSGFEGVRDVTVLDRLEGERLVSPWIGTEGLDALPIPRLIRIRVDEKQPPDFAALATLLEKAVPAAKLDTHRRWEAELRRMASTLTLLSTLVLAVILLSAVAMVVFATRAVLAANRGIVEVLQIAGADDDFIAAAINRRFVASGLWAGLLGLLGGLLTFFALGRTSGSEANGLASAARGLFNLPREGDWQSYGWFLLVPVVATVLALLTSRLTLRRMLGKPL